LFNAAEIHDRALAFAARLLREKKNPEAIIRRAFSLALGRSPLPDEVDICLTHWKDATSEEKEKLYAKPDFPTEIKRTVMAEKTGQPYDFIEIMPAYKNYIPDLQPAQTNARTRGLAQVCLVLFNLNEFAYLD
jgi:Uma2 family endonuclease